jgi:hypothetical protein
MSKHRPHQQGRLQQFLRFVFCPAECPDFIALDTLGFEIAHVSSMMCSTCSPSITKKLCYGIHTHARQSSNGSHAHALYKQLQDLSFLFD